jgi:hypothetical protein
MTIKRHTVRPQAHRGLLTAACALLVLCWAGTAAAQLPGGSPTQIFVDTFDAGSVDTFPVAWTEYHWDPYGSAGDWLLQNNADLSAIKGPCPGDTLRWTSGGSFFLRTTNTHLPPGAGQSILFPDAVLSGGSIPVADRTNIRVEFDFVLRDDPEGRAGVVWAASDSNGDNVVDDGYLFHIDDIPDDGATGSLSNYVLIKRTAGVDTVLQTGVIDMNFDPTWPAGVQVQFKQFDCASGSCSEIGWTTAMTWLWDPSDGPEPAAGAVGVFSGSNSSSSTTYNFFDNVEISTWGSCGTPTPVPTATALPTATPTPGPECSEWTAWTDENVEPLKFKLLYEGGLIDYSAGRNVPARKIDVNTTSPDPLDTGTYCDGWRLLVNLPLPVIASDLTKVRHFLEDTATAVDLVSDGAGTFTWSPDFDEDELSGTYNPVPIVADGATPIGASLMDAYDWYISERQPGGRWEIDPLADCRKWYVILITDGADTCATPGTFACDPSQAADLFANPEQGIEPVPIFTIGFSEALAAAPPQLTCISDKTDGEYFGARNARELKNALYGVLNQLNTDEARVFTPFKVSPPPSSRGGPASQQDFLVVYPFFQGKRESSLWPGNLYGFMLDESQPTLPVDNDCEVDASQLVVEAVSGDEWNAAARLSAQLAAFTPVRPVMMSAFDLSGAGTGWTRHDLTEVTTNATLRLYLQTIMDVPGGVTNLETQEVVNFVRGIWMDNDTGATPDPRTPARPDGYPALGDIFHSQPVVVSPPNRSMFYFDYGYGSAHDYPSFMETHAKRRRVVVAGANDGLLHFFDGGIWDRDRSGTGETYHEQHDLGNGSELLAFMPHAVARKLYGMTYGETQQYMVDGLIAVSDVFIDHDGDTNREWRTVAIATMRRGGRGMVGLDITQPDPIGSAPDYEPTVPSDQFPDCIDGTTSGCDGDYPMVLWEWFDTDDDDGNCPLGLTGAQCSPFWDLGWTWSKPAIARIAVYNSSDPTNPDDEYVAFFGGGWDRQQADYTGNFIYGVKIDDGSEVYKVNVGVSAPGSPTALDSDIDGFHDRIYFGDSDGSVYRIQFPGPEDSGATGGGAGTLTRIFDFRTISSGGPGFNDRQQFFTRPVTVPALFDGSGYTWAVALGSGDRADLDFYDDVGLPVDHFYFLLDVGDTDTRNKNDLVAINYDELDGDFDCENSALDPANGNYGWYLSLRPNEKVVYDATVINGHVLFPTFDPTPNVFATHNVPDECIPSAGGPTPTPTPTPNLALGEEIICKAAGIGRAYDLWFECGLGDYSENDDIYTGVEDYTIGGTTYVTFTESKATEGETEEFPNVTGHVVTNWRQD